MRGSNGYWCFRGTFKSDGRVLQIFFWPRIFWKIHHGFMIKEWGGGRKPCSVISHFSYGYISVSIFINCTREFECTRTTHNCFISPQDGGVGFCFFWVSKGYSQRMHKKAFSILVVVQVVCSLFFLLNFIMNYNLYLCDFGHFPLFNAGSVTFYLLFLNRISH